VSTRGAANHSPFDRGLHYGSRAACSCCSGSAKLARSVATMHNVRRGSLLLIIAMCGCRKESQPMSEPTFQFTVEEVFYLKPPVDRVHFGRHGSERHGQSW
jgi:hypothetical protein